MDPVSDKAWKQTVGFPINYDSEQSSGDDFDIGDVVMRRGRVGRSASRLLEDGGDGAAADLLGTTPPRSRIRDKEKRRNIMESELGRKVFKDNRRNTVANFHSPGEEPDHESPGERRKRSSLKAVRTRERDLKLDMGGKEYRSDSLPSPQQAMPTLVESCSRFMSLSSRLKCMAPAPVSAQTEPAEPAGPPAPQSRVDFHQTFSLLINMGNVDKGCRRTISREEQVWQNELKDLIWLELQARLAGRALSQHDAWLCAARRAVPLVLHNICHYRFVNNNPCRPPGEQAGGGEGGEEDDGVDGCLSFSCETCSDAIGQALREVGILLDSYYNALALYPSSKAMMAEHPLMGTQLFNNRLKALCLWYNMSLNLRSRLLGVRAHLRALSARRRAPPACAAPGGDCRQSDKPCRVRFNINGTPTDSNNSDSSSQSDQTPPTPAPDSDTSAQQSDISARQSDTSVTQQPDAAVDESANPAQQSDVSAQQTDTPASESESPAVEGQAETETQSASIEGQTEIEVQSPRDEVDNVGERPDFLPESSDANTPEIRLHSDCYNANETVETTASSESGYASEWSERGDADSDVYSMGSLDDLTSLCLLGHCEVSPYRYYLSDILKTQGVRRSMMFIQKLRQHILQKVYLAFEKPDDGPTPEGEEGACPADGVFAEACPPDGRGDVCEQQAYELRRYGSWSAECQAMRLPSYRSHFLLLSTLSLEVVHDYLALRLSARPARPSCLTVKQMIHELKEGIDLATDMRAAYVRHLRAALLGYRAPPAARRPLRLALRTLDTTVRCVLQQYLSYLTTLSQGKHLPRAQLEAEWSFTARLAARATCVADLAPPAFTDIVCNQIDRLLSEFQSKFDGYFTSGKDDIIETDDADARRQMIYALCREAQHFQSAARERMLHAVQAARALAERLLRAPPPAFRPLRQRIFQRLLRARTGIVEINMRIIELGAGALEAGEALGEGLSSRLRELLLQVFRLGFELHKELYRYVREPERATQVLRARPTSLQPPRATPPPRRRRPETVLVHDSVNPLLHKELHRFVSDSLRSRTSPASAAASSGAPRRPRLMREESIVEDTDDKLFDERYKQKQSSIEYLLSDAAPAGAPPPASAAPPAPAEGEGEGMEEQWAQQVGRAIIQFAQCWMRFVTQRCERGRGLRPRWASQGLEFLMLACDPYNTKHLSDSEFEELKQLMDECISHVIGSRTPRTPEPVAAPPRRARARYRSPMAGANGAEGKTGAAPPSPPSPPARPDPLAAFHSVDSAEHRRRVSAAAAALDGARDAALRARRAVGRVCRAAPSYEPKLRQVTFKWQRGLKIGAGTFGKVYTVINTETSQLLAMKELAVCANDRRSLQRAANELQVLEGVIHPHLVRYYGCELHREEMLIFMELCVEGSLEALLGAAGALPEHTCRKYCKQLLAALAELHARGIAHRDVKSGNIFLTNEGHCLKLGDFGCAVKIRANTTAAGELQGTVGTQAYMAPEVFMKSSGHGRAADIWSLGCVVAEMASGKRPWSEYDSNYQIMFVVGMGGRPAVPDSLSDEGRDFCRRCLTHEPDLRPRAAALAQHHFLMVKSDEDCNCQPGFLITKGS